MYRHVSRDDNVRNMVLDPQQNFDQDAIEAFKRRQQLDYKRYERDAGIHRRKPFHARYAQTTADVASDSDVSIIDYSSSEGGGEEGWRNSEGDRLRDFGVDEEAEFYDEDDIPLATLIQRRRSRISQQLQDQ